MAHAGFVTIEVNLVYCTMVGAPNTLVKKISLITGTIYGDWLVYGRRQNLRKGSALQKRVKYGGHTTTSIAPRLTPLDGYWHSKNVEDFGKLLFQPDLQMWAGSILQ